MKQIGGKTISEIAKKQFGFSELRPGQQQAIQSIVGGTDTLLVAPTGSGKSAVYQIAGLLMDGAVLVVSPLIALQKDQVDSIDRHGLGRDAVILNSTRKTRELEQDLLKVREQKSKFIFLAPEQLAKEETMELLRQANIRLMVVDEAHCVSEWGHDFRPDYLGLGAAFERLEHPAVLAMTATATHRVREEIVNRLGMRNPQILVGGFDRPNIYLRVDRFKEADKKLEGLLHRVRWAEKPGIVYVRTRSAAETIMAGLAEEGVEALFYHAGMKASERTEVQDRFMSGDADVIVATNAFGMGIDKENVRFVYHFDAPDSLDAYYQEVGRAGRDGARAEAVLFFRKEDIGSLAFQTGQASVDWAAFQQVLDALLTCRKAPKREQLADVTGLSSRKLTSILQKMEEAGVVRQLKSGGFRTVRNFGLESVTSAAIEGKERLAAQARHRLQQMRDYADTSGCRRAMLLEYFGEEPSEECLNCDNCEAKKPEAAVDHRSGTRREVA